MLCCMFGMSRLFRSRWAALLWAAGVLFSAWQFASDPPVPDTEGADPTSMSNTDAALASALR